MNVSSNSLSSELENDDDGDNDNDNDDDDDDEDEDDMVGSACDSGKSKAALIAAAWMSFGLVLMGRGRRWANSGKFR